MRVLFLCTGNSCRSQMAEGWARALKADVIEPASAGVMPCPLNPLAVQVMAEAGVDMREQCSKHVAELNGEYDCVVTVCDAANEACPALPVGVKRVHVPFDDPPSRARLLASDAEKLQVYRRVRDEIRAFVAGMPDNLQ